jgi:hypothetical protein
VPLPDPAAIASEFAATLILPAVASVTFAPPDAAGPLSVAVQVAAAPGFKETGLHARELTVAGGLTLTVPAVAARAEGSPTGVDAKAPLIPTLTAPDPLIVADTFAITPLAIAVAFIPLATQLYPADAAAHVNVLPAAVNAGPAVTEILDTLAG